MNLKGASLFPMPHLLLQLASSEERSVFDFSISFRRRLFDADFP
jgi:hypothetical protein